MSTSSGETVLAFEDAHAAAGRHVLLVLSGHTSPALRAPFSLKGRGGEGLGFFFGKDSFLLCKGQSCDNNFLSGSDVRTNSAYPVG